MQKYLKGGVDVALTDGILSLIEFLGDWRGSCCGRLSRR